MKHFGRYVNRSAAVIWKTEGVANSGGKNNQKTSLEMQAGLFCRELGVDLLQSFDDVQYAIYCIMSEYSTSP